MSQKNEDSIDKFFRKAVVQQDKTFLERDWQRLEQMLDERDMTVAATRAGGIKKAMKVSALLMILSFMLVLNDKEIAPLPMQAMASVETSPRNEKVMPNLATDLHSFQACITVDTQSKGSFTKEDVGSIGASDKRVANTSFSNSHQRQGLKKQMPHGAPILNSNDYGQKNLAPVSSMSSTAPTDEEVPKGPGASESANVSLAQNPIRSANEENGLALDSAMKASADQHLEKENFMDEGSKDTPMLTLPRLQVTASVSPDFSTTNLFKYSKPSSSVGIMIGYRVSKRLTVVSGVTKTLKKYEGYGAEYSPPEGYWQRRTNGIIPDEIEGSCGILEVPVMLQLDVLQRVKSRMFISAGVSSYFMRSEHYRYTFNEPNPGAADSWTAQEPTNYIFKIGHLSAGYDRMITKRLALGFEPFLKVPFEGIGWTDINLYSAGALLNVRYTIAVRREATNTPKL